MKQRDLSMTPTSTFTRIHRETKKNVQECLKCCCTRRRDQEKKLSRIDDGCTRKHKHSKSYTTSFEFIKSSDKPTSDWTGDDDASRHSQSSNRKLLLRQVMWWDAENTIWFNWKYLFFIIEKKTEVWKQKIFFNDFPIIEKICRILFFDYFLEEEDQIYRGFKFNSTWVYIDAIFLKFSSHLK